MVRWEWRLFMCRSTRFRSLARRPWASWLFVSTPLTVLTILATAELACDYRQSPLLLNNNSHKLYYRIWLLAYRRLWPLFLCFELLERCFYEASCIGNIYFDVGGMRINQPSSICTYPKPRSRKRPRQFTAGTSKVSAGRRTNRTRGRARMPPPYSGSELRFLDPH